MVRGHKVSGVQKEPSEVTTTLKSTKVDSESMHRSALSGIGAIITSLGDVDTPNARLAIGKLKGAMEKLVA